MSKELDRLRKDVRAQLELMWGSQSESNSRIEKLSRSIEANADTIVEQGRQIAEQGRQIAEQGRQIAEQGQRIAEQGQRIAEQSLVIQASMKQSAAIGREVVALGDQMVGRLRQFDYKFGQLLGAIEKDSDQRFVALEKRVSRLEKKGDPAA